MKILKILGLIILTVIVIFLVSGLFIKKDFEYEMSKEMAISKDKVWENVVYFKNHEKWSQWKKMDPNMKVEITGTDGTPGAKMSWTSTHKDVGNGSQTIVSVSGTERVDSKLDFGGKGEANTYMSVMGDSTKCKVTWSLKMTAPYPFNTFMFMMGDKPMNDMFKTGLDMLETASK